MSDLNRSMTLLFEGVLRIWWQPVASSAASHKVSSEFCARVRLAVAAKFCPRLDSSRYNPSVNDRFSRFLASLGVAGTAQHPSLHSPTDTPTERQASGRLHFLRPCMYECAVPTTSKHSSWLTQALQFCTIKRIFFCLCEGCWLHSCVRERCYTGGLAIKDRAPASSNEFETTNKSSPR